MLQLLSNVAYLNSSLEQITEIEIFKREQNRIAVTAQLGFDRSKVLRRRCDSTLPLGVISHPVRYLIWDFDNTLAHRPGLWSQCLADLANSVVPNAGLTRDHFVPHLSTGFPWHAPEVAHPHLCDSEAWWKHINLVLANALVSVAGIESSVAAKAVLHFRARYIAPDSWVVYPDVLPALAALTARGWRHIILSNHVPELPTLVAALGLGGYFERVLTSAALGYEKPNAMAFALVVAALPVGSRAVMVGDSFVADYQGAQAAGLDAVLVRTSNPNCEVSVPDLHALVARLNNA